MSLGPSELYSYIENGEMYEEIRQFVNTVTRSNGYSKLNLLEREVYNKFNVDTAKVNAFLASFFEFFEIFKKNNTQIKAQFDSFG